MTPPPPLACTVRQCGRPLVRGDRSFTCAAGHAYDIARSGYVNLLQPQDRRSPAGGDSKAAVESRAALGAAGIGRKLIDAVVELAAELAPADHRMVVDLGSGTGDALAEVAAERPTVGIGIDLSTAAAEHAARRSPHLTWVVANADRRLPLLDQTIDLVLSLHGRRNPSECARVLIDGGCVLVALPGADDLIELRALVQGSGLARPRGDRMLAEHRPYFDLVRQIPVRETVDLDRQAVQQVLRSTYRGARRAEVSRVEQLEGVRATVSADLFVLRRGQAR